jgi:hypothetical protein
MVYQGTVKNGVVVFENGSPPDGTPVRVETIDQKPRQVGSIWDKMASFAGRASGLPKDAALNHDHYLYGKPKR